MAYETPNFVLGIAGYAGRCQAETSILSPFMEGDAQHRQEKCVQGAQGEQIDSYHLDSPRVTVEVVTQTLPGCAAARKHTILTNHGTEPLTITALSSALIADIDCAGVLPWHDAGRFRLHYCLQAWQCEGQWRSASLAEWNLLPVCTHAVAAAIHFGETGSWTTARMAPMVVLEDQERQMCWFVQLEEGAGWHIEIAHRGDTAEGTLCILADTFSERFGGGRRLRLEPGARVESSHAAVGCCAGGFEEAVGALTAYRRAFLRRLPSAGEYPVVFNDYMNCLWGDPTEEKLLPLIDCAAELGAEYFCIDAGWFSAAGTPWSNHIGDWEPSPDRFGAIGFEGVLGHMQARGLRPGIWMELESVNGQSDIYARAPADWLLRRDGQPVGSEERWFWDYANPAVRAHFTSVIDRLYRQGVRYIKNDYNDSFAGADNYTDNALHSVQIAASAFADFLEELARRYPDLLIENCGSGAMRSDYGILAHCHVQSIPDQEWYRLAPSILMGTLAQLLPEQASCWAYPYPLLFGQRARAQEPDFWEELRIACASGEETIFNMVTALNATPLLSGRVDRADAQNRELIREAVALFKARREFIRNARPVFPLGMRRIEDETGFACLGLLCEGKLQLAVWRYQGGGDSVTIPLEKYGDPRAIRQIYPMRGYAAEAALVSGAAVLRLAAPYSARLFEVEFRV